MTTPRLPLEPLKHVPITPTRVARVAWLVITAAFGAFLLLGLLGYAMSSAIWGAGYEHSQFKEQLPRGWRSQDGGDITLHPDGTGYVVGFPVRGEDRSCASAAHPFTGEVAWYQAADERLWLVVDGADYSWSPRPWFGWDWDKINVRVCGEAPEDQVVGFFASSLVP